MVFDMKKVKELFGVLQRLHDQDEFDDAGKGLVNVLRIVSLHGGKTLADGSEGGRATSYFTLPKTKEAWA